MSKFTDWHLYTGCDVKTPYGICKYVYTKTGIDDTMYNPIVVDRGDIQFAFKMEEVKFILRHITSMTEEEQREEYLLTRFCESDTESSGRQGMARGFRYLLSKGFDLFGLINSGQAIDKATLKDVL
jgi:hypothetical protein